MDEIKNENLMINHLFFKYSKMLSQKTIISELSAYIPRKIKIEILELILGNEKNHKYCALLENKINVLKSSKTTNKAIQHLPSQFS